MSSDSVIATNYEGHQAPVLSLDYSDDNLLLSGSEDHTARLWDIRESRRRACLCIPTQGEVLSVSFCPRQPDTMSVDMTNPFAKDHTIYLSTENHVLEYDLRLSSGPILQQPTRVLSEILQNQDEVNQVALTHFRKPPPPKKSKRGKGSNNQNRNSSPSFYIAAADDAGTVRFMEDGSSQSQVLHHGPNGVAVVPCCAFRPGSFKGLELVSGGTDCKLNFWDLLKPKKPISTYTMQQPESGDSNKPQVCNPPMVYSLAWSPSGRLLAAGLGDGNIPLFSIENRNLVQTGYLPDGHDSSVASVVFPRFAASRERIVLSGGTDGSILCWDAGPNVLLSQDNDDSLSDPSTLFPESLLRGNGSSPTDEITRQAESISLQELEPRVLFGIPHGRKLNWMTTTPNSVFVADTSPVVTSYQVPLQ